MGLTNLYKLPVTLMVYLGRLQWDLNILQSQNCQQKVQKTVKPAKTSNYSFIPNLPGVGGITRASIIFWTWQTLEICKIFGSDLITAFLKWPYHQDLKLSYSPRVWKPLLSQKIQKNSKPKRWRCWDPSQLPLV